MTDKKTYRLLVWIEDELDGPLDTDHVLARVGRAIGTLGDLPVHVACDGPIRKDTGR